jgi:hypothetical protein
LIFSFLFDFSSREKREKNTHLLLFSFSLFFLSLSIQGELDWKVLCLDARTDNDEGSSKIKIASLAELEAAKPGEVERVVHWFSTYKKLEGGQDGAIGLGGKVLGASRAADVVAEGERAYGKLVSTTAAGSSKEK